MTFSTVLQVWYYPILSQIAFLVVFKRLIIPDYYRSIRMVRTYVLNDKKSGKLNGNYAYMILYYY